MNLEIIHRINLLQSRQLQLRAIMAASDDRAAKCVKTGLLFRETYPDDFVRYQAANDEYNRNEQTLAALETIRAAEHTEMNSDPNAQKQ